MSVPAIRQRIVAPERFDTFASVLVSLLQQPDGRCRICTDRDLDCAAAIVDMLYGDAEVGTRH